MRNFGQLMQLIILFDTRRDNMDHRLVNMFSPSDLAGSFLVIALRDVVRILFEDETYENNDTPKILKKLTQCKNTVVANCSSRLLETRNTIIHNKPDLDYAFESVVSVLDMISDEVECSSLSAFLLLCGFCEKSRAITSTNPNRPNIKGGMYQRIGKFSGTFDEFSGYGGYHLIEKIITIEGKRYRFLKWRDSNVLVEDDKGRKAFLLSAKFECDEMYPSFNRKPGFLYRVDDLKFETEGNGPKVANAVLELLDLRGVDVDEKQKDEIVSQYNVAGYDDGKIIKLKNLSKINIQANVNHDERLEEEGITTFAETRNSKTERDKDWLKGKKIKVASGKHIGRICTFIGWSGTSVKVLFEGEEESMMLNVGRHYILQE
jgi:hypothetical protein